MPTHVFDPDMPDLMEKSAQAADLLRLLGNQKRLLLACHLAMRGEMPAGALAEAVGLSMPALSQHLALLRDGGIVASRRDAQSIIYRLSDPRAAEVLALLHRLYCGPDAAPLR